MNVMRVIALPVLMLFLVFLWWIGGAFVMDAIDTGPLWRTIICASAYFTGLIAMAGLLILSIIRADWDSIR